MIQYWLFLKPLTRALKKAYIDLLGNELFYAPCSSRKKPLLISFLGEGRKSLSFPRLAEKSGLLKSIFHGACVPRFYF